MSQLAAEAARRRTFAIISHPDAGKTTLTEKLLLFGGAIQLAGAVKAKGELRRARSDWMKVEQERGISVTASVMTFEHDGMAINLLDTPGHEDFSEDTYRTLTAVDSAVMVLDAAKGIEAQTLKLFEVCRLRDVPIVSFINKLDRESRDPFSLIDEIESRLALAAAPVTWPIGSGRSFKGCYDLLHDRLLRFEDGSNERVGTEIALSGLDDPRLAEELDAAALEQLKAEIELVRSEEAHCGLARGEWSAEQIALVLVAAQPLQGLELSARLHSLGSYLQLEAVRHGNHGVDDGGVLGVGLDIAHEAAVDLERVDWQLAQILERGVTGAEVVHCDTHAVLAELAQHCDVLLGVLPQQ